MNKEKLKRAIAYAGTNQAKLAESLGISRASFGHRLDKMRFSEEELNQIAELIGAKYVDFFEFPDGIKI